MAPKNIGNNELIIEIYVQTFKKVKTLKCQNEEYWFNNKFWSKVCLIAEYDRFCAIELNPTQIIVWALLNKQYLSTVSHC